MRKLILCLFFLCTLISVNGQRGNNRWCKATQPTDAPTDILPVHDVSTRLNDPDGVIIIPVVVHVLWNNATENISDALIQSQIARLNLDFRKLNPEVPVYAPWAAVQADAKFEFKLACIDPQGLSTNGIVRKFTPVGQFMNHNELKLNSTGGDDCWPTDTYFNIWTGDLDDASNYLGHAQFPEQYYTLIGGIPGSLLDGIVLDYKITGDNNGDPYNNLGRVASHEVGHWLGLYHTFSESLCAQLHPDIPPQYNHYMQVCPSFPQTDPCSPPPTGAQFMNYMNYTDDPCRFMFSASQKTKMRGYYSATGPYPVRYPFINNYFGINHLPSNPWIMSGNLIQLDIRNPACIPTSLVSLSGPVTLYYMDDHHITLYAPNCASGNISISVAAGNYIDDYTFTIQNPACPAPLWPKVYYGDKYIQLTKGQSGNIYLDLQLQNSTPNFQHQGNLPFTQPGAYTIQYNASSAVTEWVKNDQVITYALSNGDIQVENYTGGLNYQYYNGITGFSASPPAGVPTGHKIMVEKSPGVFVTASSVSVHTYLHIGTDMINVDGLKNVKYNPASKTLFVFYYTSSPVTLHMDKYDLTNNTFAPLGNTTFPYATEIVQVDNQDWTYFVWGGVLRSLSASGAYGIVSIPGFTNSDVISFYADSYASMIEPYTNNRCLVGQTVEQRIYALDLVALTQRKLNTSNLLDAPNWWLAAITTDYIIDGNTVFIAGSMLGAYQSSITLGSQQINFLGTGYFSNYLAKLDLNADFTSRISENIVSNQASVEMPFIAKLFPNPSSNSINIIINDKMNDHTIAILDQMKNVVMKLERYRSGNTIDISWLKPGVYYMEIVNRKGEKIGQIFSKL